jgi:hypothetical protein
MPGGPAIQAARRRRAARRGPAALAGALLAAVAPGAAATAADWGTPADLADGHRPSIAMLSDRALTAWTGGDARPGPLRVAAHVAARPARGAGWSVAGPLGPAYHAHDLAAGGSRVVLAMRPDSTTRPSPGAPYGTAEQRLLVRVLEGGSWTRQTVLSAPRRRAAVFDVDLDGTGTAIAVWVEVVGWGGPGAVRASVRPPNGRWQDAETLAPSGAREPALVAGPGGALAAWVADEPGGGGAVWVAARPAGGGWEPPRRLAASPSMPSRPALALNGAGEAVVAWLQDGALLAAGRGRDGAWGAPERISGEAAAHAGVSGPAAWAAIDEDGAALVAWQSRARPDTVDVVAATRPAGGAWRAPETVSLPDERGAGAPAIAQRGGRVIAAWSQPRGGSGAVVMAREVALATGAWSAPERVSAPGEIAIAPSVAMDSRGRAVLVYEARRDGLRVADRPAARAPARSPVRLGAEQLLINQRISQAALRRVNAVAARLDAGLTGADIRLGSLTERPFLPNVPIIGSETSRVVDPGPVVPVQVAAPARRRPSLELSARQLLINQRISQAAVRRSVLLRRRLDLGLTGEDVRDGSLTAAHLAPGLLIGPAGDAAAPAVPPPRLAEPAFPGAGGRVRLSRDQLRINQRIAQAAVRRANALVVQLEGGFGADDFRPGSLGGADLAPGAR